MALRLTGSPTTASPATPPDPSAAAAACLDRHDLDGYAALFARRRRVADVHARYAARTKLVEAALRAGQAADRARVPAIYLAAARATVALLEEEPREPVLLNYAGVLLYELWSPRRRGRAVRRRAPARPRARERRSATWTRSRAGARAASRRPSRARSPSR